MTTIRSELGAALEAAGIPVKDRGIQPPFARVQWGGTAIDSALVQGAWAVWLIIPRADDPQILAARARRAIDLLDDYVVLQAVNATGLDLDDTGDPWVVLLTGDYLADWTGQALDDVPPTPINPVNLEALEWAVS